MDYIIDKEGKKREAKIVICDFCGKSFLKPKRFIKENSHNYCCKECSSLSLKKQIEIKCDFCGNAFMIKPSKLYCSKSGLHFCCRKCKDNAQKIISGFKEMQPNHYGKTIYNDYTPSSIYQRICFSYHPHKCCVCGEENIVAVHHYDGNHNNNDPVNLVPLCPTHHQYIHSRYKDEIIDIVDKYVEEFINKKGNGTA